MKCRFPKKIFIPIAFCGLFFSSSGQTANDLLLKNYRPVSIYKTPVSDIQKASFPVIDMHSHSSFAETTDDIKNWVRTMDAVGMAKIVLLTYQTGNAFDSIVKKYKPFPGRFQFWCGFDYTGYGRPGWINHAVAELERCHAAGATGVGELGDKGFGDMYSKPVPGIGIHIDNPQLKPLLQRCAALGMPISIHVGEDEWMYRNPDSTNDGLMNAAKWHVNLNKTGGLDHDQLIHSLENAVRENPKTVFIACHFANCCTDLQKLGDLLDKYPNLYADISARFGEIAPVPRYAAAFIIKYQNRLLYGTDFGTDPQMYRTTFRILETADEHFYETDLFGYHWALYGLNLPSAVLKKLYRENAQKLLTQAP